MEGALSHLRRTPLRRLLEANGATWATVGDCAIAEHANPPAEGRLDAPAANVATLAIADLSPLPRLGFKGPETIAAMKRQGVVVGAVPNKAFCQPDGTLCLVLAPGEVLLLSGLGGDSGKLAQLAQSWSIDSGERTYLVPRRDSHAWLVVTGTLAPQMFAKVCAIDLRAHKFSDLDVAQTYVAKLPAIIARSDLGPTPAFHLLADSAAALYLFSCLADAAREFGGGLIGLADLRDHKST